MSYYCINETVKNFFRKIKSVIQICSRYKNYLEILTGSPSKIKNLQLRNGIVFEGGSTSQLLVVTDEIFFDNVYALDEVVIEKGDIVVDIGANIGIFDVYAATQGAGHIYAYEPLPSNVDLIKINQALNHFDNLTITQAAVSDKMGKAKLYLGNFDAGNLLFDHNIVGKLSKYISVSTITLENILKIQHLSKIDFLKIDCEGSEGAIFATTPPSVWKKVRKIALEFHDNVSQLSHQQIQEILKDLGFKTHIHYDGQSSFGYLYGYR